MTPAPAEGGRPGGKGIVRDLLGRQFVRFVLVGMLNTAFGYSVYAALVLIHVHYSAAAVLSTVAGVLFNFKTTGPLVFGSRGNRRFFRFVAVYAVMLAINVTALWALHDRLGLGSLVSQALCLPPLVVMTFLMQKHLVFRK